MLLERLQCSTIWLSETREYRYVEALREMMQQEKEQKWLRHEKDRQDVQQKRLEASRQQVEEHHRAEKKIGGVQGTVSILSYIQVRCA